MYFRSFISREKKKNVTKNSWLILYIDLLYKMGQDFLDLQYEEWKTCLFSGRVELSATASSESSFMSDEIKEYVILMWPILYSNSLQKMGQDFLDLQYRIAGDAFLEFYVTRKKKNVKLMWPILYSNLLYKICQDFLDLQYRIAGDVFSEFYFTRKKEECDQEFLTHLIYWLTI